MTHPLNPLPSPHQLYIPAPYFVNIIKTNFEESDTHTNTHMEREKKTHTYEHKQNR